jgi:flagellar M-ring protein FliF
VHTSAQLDFSQTNITSNIYNPNNQGPIPVQQASSGQTYVGPAASQAAGGILGATTTPAGTTVTTVPGGKAKKAGGGKAPAVTTTTVPTYTQVGKSQQNVVSEVTKTVQSAPGTLVRLSVAVVVNSSVKGVKLQTIKQLVSAAAGLQPSRGDSIQVAFVPFNQSLAKLQAQQLKAAASANSQAALMGEARTGAIVLVVLALLLFAIRRITKTTRVPMALPAGYQPLELEAGEDDDETMALPAQAALPEMATLTPQSSALQAEVSQLGEMIEREPERIAEMLRAWLETSPSEK